MSRPHRPNMITEAEAKERVLAGVVRLPTRKVALAEALRRYVARDVVAVLPAPAFTNSAMDGYAVRASSCAPDARLTIVGEQPAGRAKKLRVGTGEAVRIFTGAPLPDGADAVVMQEETSERDGFVTIKNAVAPGEFVRLRGAELAEGQTIVVAGTRITAPVLALLASQGFAEVEAGAKVKVAILSTGDELVGAGVPLEPGELYESNSVLLGALVSATGAVVSQVEHCADEPSATAAALRRGMEHDVLIVSGGVSVGARDYVKDSLRAIGVELDLWRVAVKPGKPFLFGRAETCAVFGLPGNPVSAFVTFLLFVRPALLKMAGAAPSELTLPLHSAILETSLTNDGDRPHYVRGRLEHGRFSAIGRQESHALFGLSRANALLRLEPGQDFEAGAAVEVLVWD